MSFVPKRVRNQYVIFCLTRSPIRDPAYVRFEMGNLISCYFKTLLSSLTKCSMSNFYNPFLFSLKKKRYIKFTKRERVASLATLKKRLGNLLIRYKIFSPLNKVNLLNTKILEKKIRIDLELKRLGLLKK